jgi:tetratricopeptide (TPR) repeat protein
MTEREALEALRGDDPALAARAAETLWQMWHRSGDPRFDHLLRDGIDAMEHEELSEAEAAFTRLIEEAPDFAEGWNKRATVYYLVGEYEKSLRDCDEVMKRNPAHFGALAGYGQIYLRLGQPEKALGYFERALGVNPNMEQVELTVQEIKRFLAEKRRGTI